MVEGPRGNLADAPRLLLLGVLGLVVLMPYIWMISASLKPLDELFRASLQLWPERFHAIENYGRVFSQIPVFHYLWNGVVVCAGILFFQLLFAVPAGYALAKLNFPGRDYVFGLVMLGLLVSPHVPALPLYVAFSQLGWLNTYAALILPFTISVFAIFLFRQFFKALPDELIHAARRSGASCCRTPGPRQRPSQSSQSSPIGMICSGRSLSSKDRRAPLRRSAFCISDPMRRATISRH